MTKDTELTRVDKQDAWDDTTKSIQEWYKYVLENEYDQDRLTEEELDSLISDSKLRNTPVETMIEEIISYGDWYEFDFKTVEGLSLFDSDNGNDKSKGNTTLVTIEELLELERHLNFGVSLLKEQGLQNNEITEDLEDSANRIAKLLTDSFSEEYIQEVSDRLEE